jgi:Mg/Co/Ni transporter MgtE
MDTTQDTLLQVENVYLTTLIKLLKNGTLPNKEGKAITKEFLALRPFTDMKDMRDKFKAFTDEHRDFLPMYVTFLHHEDVHTSGGLLNQMKDLLNNKKIDEALALVTPNHDS